LTEEGKAIPREREAELVAGWQGQGWWEGHYYNVTIIGHTWGVAKVSIGLIFSEVDIFI
jgi:hypothetical protein